MDKFLLFLKIIAWILAIGSTLIFSVCVYLTFQYPGSVDELMDKLKGVRRSYPLMPWLITMIITWSFIIAFW